MASMGALLVAFLLSGIHGALAVTFTFRNNCPETVWPATLTSAGRAPFPTTGFSLPAGPSLVANGVPPEWSGRVWARYRCTTDTATGHFSCESGDCTTGQVVCQGVGGVPPATLAEFTLKGNAGMDFYDISNVDGFNLPIEVAPEGGTGDCRKASCPANINRACPNELAVRGPATNGSGVIGCKSACLAFNTDRYCCRGSYGVPDKCPPSNYSRFFKAQCPQAYSYAYDDQTSTFTCVGANYRITFCP